MSIGWLVALAWSVLMSLVWFIFTPAVLSWTGLAVVGVVTWFALAAALSAAEGSSRSRSVAQVIADTEAEPALAVVSVSARPGLWPGPRSDNRIKGVRAL